MHKIGIDLGGTKIEGILLDEKYNTIQRKRTETHQENGYDSIVESIVTLVNELWNNAMEIAEADNQQEDPEAYAAYRRTRWAKPPASKEQAEELVGSDISIGICTPGVHIPTDASSPIFPLNSFTKDTMDFTIAS